MRLWKAVKCWGRVLLREIFTHATPVEVRDMPPRAPYICRSRLVTCLPQSPSKALIEKVPNLKPLDPRPAYLPLVGEGLLSTSYVGMGRLASGSEAQWCLLLKPVDQHRIPKIHIRVQGQN
jgi:hypothetical protein